MSQVFHLAGVDLAYTVEGSGEPVVLLTGLGGDGRGWGDQTGRFASEFTTIVPDHPGTGRSGMPAAFSLTNHADAMAELLRRLGYGPAHLVGSSTGGAIAFLMALDHPDVVRSVSAVSSWARPDDHFRHQFAVRKDVLRRSGSRAYAEATALFLYSPAFFVGHYPAVRDWCAIAAKGDPDVMARRIDMILDYDVADRLPAIDVPTLVLVGDQDACTPPHHSRAIAEAVPGARLEILEGGHLIYKEAPQEFHRVVREFVASV